MATNGYAAPSAAAGIATLAAGDQLGSTADAPTADLWLYELSCRAGRPAGGATPTTAMAVWHTASGNPSSRWVKTAAFSVATVMASGADGAVFARALETAVGLGDGHVVAYGLTSSGGSLNVGMKPAPAGDNNLFYRRGGLGGSTPTDPFGYTTSSYEGQLAVWASAQANSPPNRPTSVLINGASASQDGGSPTAIGTFTPGFSGNFADADETMPNGLPADLLKASQFQVIESDGTLKWDSGELTATSAQQSARVYAKTYDGPALVAGRTYKLRCRCRDQFDAWSPWSSDGSGTYRYFAVGGGAIDAAAATPVGKAETQTPGPFSARWTHTGGLATNALQVQVQDATSGAVLRDSGAVAKAVANNGTAQLSATEVGLVAAPLPWGTAATWRMRGRDTGGTWGAWSIDLALPIDDDPTVPMPKAPANAAVVTGYPLLAATTTDADDDPATGLLVKFRIKTPGPILNPTFAADAAGWTLVAGAGLTGAITRDAAQNYAGAAGAGRLQYTANTAAPATGAIARSDTFVPCVAGQDYTFRIAVRTDNANLHPRVQFRWYDAAQVATGSSTEPDWTPTVNAWSLRAWTATAPAGAAFYKVGVYAESEATGALGSVWWDAYDADPGLRYVRTGTWNAATARFEYQTVAADLPDYTVLRWDAYAFDGTVYSGATTDEASAAVSMERSVTYAFGPTPTLTAPVDGGTIATNTPTIAWTVAGPAQVSRRVTVARRSDGALLHDSGTTATASQSYVLPSALSAGLPLHEGDTVTIAVTVTDTNGLTGVDAAVVTLDYPTPPTLALAVVLQTARGDLTPSVVRASWERTAYPVAQFSYYRLTRTPSAAALKANPGLPDETVNFGRFPIGLTHFVDTRVRAGVEYVYELKQFVIQGADRLGSVPSQAIATIRFEATIVEDVRDPDRRLVLEARRERTITAVGDLVVVKPWNRPAPIHFRGDTAYDEVDCEFVLAAQTQADADYDLWLLRDMAKKPGPLLMKNGRGDLWFGEFASPPVVSDPAGGRPRSVRFLFRQLDYPESVTDED